MVDGVTSYRFPQQSLQFDPKAYTEDLNTSTEIPVHQQKKQKLNFVEDKQIDKTNAELIGPRADILRPILKAPDEITYDAVVEFNHRIERLTAKMDQYRLELENSQRDLYNMDVTLASERVKQAQEGAKALHEELKDAQTEMEARIKKSKIVGWVDTMTTIAFLAVSVISLALAVITMGLSLGMSAGMIAGLGVAKGATTIAAGALQHEAQKTEATATGLRHARDENQMKIQKIVEGLKQTSDALKRVSHDTTEFLNSQYKTIQTFRR